MYDAGDSTYNDETHSVGTSVVASVHRAAASGGGRGKHHDDDDNHDSVTEAIAAVDKYEKSHSSVSSHDAHRTYRPPTPHAIVDEEDEHGGYGRAEEVDMDLSLPIIPLVSNETSTDLDTSPRKKRRVSPPPKVLSDTHTRTHTWSIST